jgi:hypothetical protein
LGCGGRLDAAHKLLMPLLQQQGGKVMPDLCPGGKPSTARSEL